MTPETRVQRGLRKMSDRLRGHPGTAAVMGSCGLAAIVLLVVFSLWSNRYLPVVYNAIETSTPARFPRGFIRTGVIEGVAFVVVATTALTAGLAIVLGEKASKAGAGGKLLAITATALCASAILAALLDPLFAMILLVIAAGIAIVAGRSLSAQR